jgi:hypothetical protein
MEMSDAATPVSMSIVWSDWAVLYTARIENAPMVSSLRQGAVTATLPACSGPL